jgi:peptidoglycan-associated lipoprotein
MSGFGKVVVVLGGMLLVGCAGTGVQEGGGVPVEDRADVGTDFEEDQGTQDLQEGAYTRGLSDTPAFAGDPLDDPESPLATRVLYFDLDSSEISDEDRAIVEAHATYLASNPQTRLRLEGHADERGSREYNIALGERRANAVQQLMGLFGVGTQQLTSISYGEEQPAALGHDESAWQLNRRVELEYTAQ